MAKIMTKDGAKLHLVTSDGEPLCRPLVRTRTLEWEGFDTSKTMRLTEWIEHEDHCKNCAQVYRIWTQTQFRQQIASFLDLEMVKTFPITITGFGKFSYSPDPLWPKAKLIHR